MEVQRLLCGFVELKAPGKGARTNRFRSADKKQWEKFTALPNLLYTDGSEWALYRSGELQSEVVRFAGDVTVKGISALDDQDIAKLHTLLLDFLSWQPIAPNSPQALAKTLAPLCRLLREDVLAATKKAGSSLAQLAGLDPTQVRLPELEKEMQMAASRGAGRPGVNRHE